MKKIATWSILVVLVLSFSLFVKHLMREADGAGQEVFFVYKSGLIVGQRGVVYVMMEPVKTYRQLKQLNQKYPQDSGSMLNTIPVNDSLYKLQ